MFVRRGRGCAEDGERAEDEGERVGSCRPLARSVPGVPRSIPSVCTCLFVRSPQSENEGIGFVRVAPFPLSKFLLLFVLPTNAATDIFADREGDYFAPVPE